MSKVKSRKMRGFWGEYDPAKDVISLDIQLKNIARPSRPAVYFHEDYHRWIAEKGITLPEEEEELKCEIWSLMCCKKSELSYMERYLKKNIVKKFGKLSKEKILEMKKFI